MIDRKEYALTDDQMEQVSGGVVYDVKCTQCGKLMAGAGDYYDEGWAISKKNWFNKNGCPYCHKQNVMEIVLFSSIEERFALMYDSANCIRKAHHIRPWK